MKNYGDLGGCYPPRPTGSPDHRRTGNFLPGGGGKPFAQKILASCPNFYETVEKKRGPYDAIM